MMSLSSATAPDMEKDNFCKQPRFEPKFIGAHEGDMLNSKSEWRQASIIRNVIVSEGDEVLAGVQVGSFPRAGSSRSAEGCVSSGGMARESEDGV